MPANFKQTRLKHKIEKSVYPTKAKFHHSSFKHAFNGFNWALNTQPNLQIECLFTGIIMVFNIIFLYLGLISSLNVLLVTIMCFVIIAGELFNTSIEALSDEVAGGKYKEFIRIAKDTSAGAMLVLFILALLVALYAYIPVLLNIINIYIK
jgi:diacylglycerol kinase